MSKNLIDEKVSIFNLSNDNLHRTEETTGSGEYFKPSAKNGKDGVYSAVVRFIPFIKDPTNSLVDNWRVWLTNPLTDESMYVLLPPKPERNIITDAFFKLYKSEDVAEQNLSKMFSGSKSYSALVQVIKDDVNPSNNGKILIWNFGVKVWKHLDMLMHPKEYMDDESMVELGMEQKEEFPFDSTNGKLFHVKVTRVGGFNNYDECKFINKYTPIMMDGSFPKEDELATDEYRTKLVTYLEENSPDLGKQMYKPWDAKTTTHVHESIKEGIQSEKIRESLLGSGSKQTVVVNDPLSSKLLVGDNSASAVTDENTTLKSDDTSIDLELDDLDLDSYEDLKL